MIKKPFELVSKIMSRTNVSCIINQGKHVKYLDKMSIMHLLFPPNTCSNLPSGNLPPYFSQVIVGRGEPCIAHSKVMFSPNEGVVVVAGRATIRTAEGPVGTEKSIKHKHSEYQLL